MLPLACGKLENVLEFKKYCDANQVDISSGNKEMLSDPRIQDLIKRCEKHGITSLDDIWYTYHSPTFEYLGITKEIWKT